MSKKVLCMFVTDFILFNQFHKIYFSFSLQYIGCEIDYIYIYTRTYRRHYTCVISLNILGLISCWFSSFLVWQSCQSIRVLNIFIYYYSMQIDLFEHWKYMLSLFYRLECPSDIHNILHYACIIMSCSLWKFYDVSKNRAFSLVLIRTGMT